MEKDDRSERRKYSRTPLDLDVEVTLVPSDDAQQVEDIVRCKCRDISGGGISLYSMKSYPLQSVLRLHLALDKLNIKVMGKVMWTKHFPSSPSSVIGLQFLNIYEQDFKVLCSYIKSRCL